MSRNSAYLKNYQRNPIQIGKHTFYPGVLIEEMQMNLSEMDRDTLEDRLIGYSYAQACELVAKLEKLYQTCSFWLDGHHDNPLMFSRFNKIEKEITEDEDGTHVDLIGII